jgi:8-oxo-dGTP diphosphatase
VSFIYSVVSQNVVRIGVAVIICDDSSQKVLLGLRKSEHASYTWGFVGGHLEYGETPIDCAIREAKEECGLELVDVEEIGFTNDFFSESQKHYITLFFRAKYTGDTVFLCEPEKFVEWSWFSWTNLPKDVMLPILNLRKKGYNPFS